jgi:hypothetical protein
MQAYHTWLVERVSFTADKPMPSIFGFLINLGSQLTNGKEPLTQLMGKQRSISIFPYFSPFLFRHFNEVFLPTKRGC